MIFENFLNETIEKYSEFFKLLTEAQDSRYPPRYDHDKLTSQEESAEDKNIYALRTQEWISWWRNSDWMDRLKEQLLRDKWCRPNTIQLQKMKEFQKYIQSEGEDYIFVEKKVRPNDPELNIVISRGGRSVSNWDVSKSFDRQSFYWISIEKDGRVIVSDDLFLRSLFNKGLQKLSSVGCNEYQLTAAHNAARYLQNAKNSYYLIDSEMDANDNLILDFTKIGIKIPSSEDKDIEVRLYDRARANWTSWRVTKLSKTLKPKN